MEKILKQIVPLLVICFIALNSQAQKTSHLAATPPMGWLSWNYFSENINEEGVREMADAMVKSGMVEAGYQYIIIDDCWQGGRDYQNNIIPDPKKFPSGIKALATYCHEKGIKLGIYSDAGPLTCAGYTASINFEEQDAKTFASWGVDYLKYDYCNAPADSATAKIRYAKMAEALRKTGRDIVFGVCEWGERQPWHWAGDVGGQLWRSTGDIRDKWKNIGTSGGTGILDAFDINAGLDQYASPGRWNDPDMLIAGLYGKKGPSGDLGGIGCTDTEYQSQFSLWCMMASPLFTSCNLATMNGATRKILLNKEAIAINQDILGKQAVRKVNNAEWTILLKPLADSDYAVAILNRSEKSMSYELLLSSIGLEGKYNMQDLWTGGQDKSKKSWKGIIASHETKLLRLSLPAALR